MGEIVLDTINANKKLIKLYICIAAFVSVFFLYNANNSSVVVNATNTIEEGESGIDTTLYGGTMAVGVSSLSNTMGISIDPSIVLSIVAIGSILDEEGVTGNLLSGMDFGIFDSWITRIVIFAWTIITLTPGLLGMEAEELNTKYLGPVLIVACEIVYILQNQGGMSVNAADGSTTVAIAGSGVLMAFLEFIKIVVMLICFVCVRMLIYALNALIIISSKISPFFSGIFKLLKIGLTCGYLSLSKAPMWLFLILALPIVIIGFFLLKTTIVIVRYLKWIYVRPFIQKLFGRDKLPLIHKKTPKYIKNNFDFNLVSICLPVFPIKGILGHPEIIKRDLWWLVVLNENKYICKKTFGKDLIKINLAEDDAFYGKGENSYRHILLRKPGFIKGSFCEFLTIKDKSKLAMGNTITRFVFSMNYSYLFDEILNLAGFKDYEKYEEVIKQQKKDEFSEKINKFNPFKRLKKS